MRSLGAVALAWDNGWVTSHTFSVNLEPLAGAVMSARTMIEFWSKNPKAWEIATKDPQPALEAMLSFSKWLGLVQSAWRGRHISAVAGPAGFDFTFIRWYMIKFLQHSKPFNHRCDDLRSRAATILRIPYAEAGKAAFPKHWFRDGFPHTHVAVEDAMEQAWIMARMLDDIYANEPQSRAGELPRPVVPAL